MKYKDLKMGDWFIHDGRKYIKTETYSGDIVDISLENDTFGTPVPSIDDEEEVNFLTKLLYRERKDYEIPDKGGFIITDMPEGILCRFKNFEWYFTIYHGYFVDICNKFPGRCGAWLPISKMDTTQPVNIVCKADIDFQEAFDKLSIV